MMKKNHSTRTPSDIVFVDCETKPSPRKEQKESHRLRLGVAIRVRLRKGIVVRRQVLRFSKTREFWEWLYKGHDHHRATWIYAHNLGFDLTVLGCWEKVASGELSLHDPRPPRPSKGDPAKSAKPHHGYAITQDPPSMIRVMTKNGDAYVFADTLNYWQSPLKAIGESVGLPKGEMPGQEDDDAAWSAYCLRDVEIIEAAVLRLMTETQSQDLGCWKGTAPGLAMACYRHRFLRVPILIDQSPVATPLARAAYYGGECRLSFQGQCLSPELYRDNGGTMMDALKIPLIKSRVYVLDMASAYPWAMAYMPHPCKLESWFHNPTICQLESLMRRYWCAALVEIDTARQSYPVRENGRTIYASGRYWTVLCGGELEQAVGMGDVRRASLCATWHQGNLFREYVFYWWDQRRKAQASGDRMSEMYAKLMMNSLYGKFAQRSPRWIDRPDVAATVPWGPFWQTDPTTGRMVEYRSLGWFTQEKGEPGEHPESMPAISASVTAALRVKMREYRAIAGPDNVLYQDTDSLHVTEPGWLKLKPFLDIYPDGLGSLRLVGQHESAWYRGPRNYQLDGREIVAGLKRSAERVAPGCYTQPHFEQLETVLGRPPADDIIVHYRDFVLREGGDVGKLLSGGRVLPHRLTRPELTEELAGLLHSDFHPVENSRHLDQGAAGPEEV